MKNRVIIESPFAGDRDRNLRYLRSCLRDSLQRGEAPFASHGLYTQPGVLEDDNPAERKLGIESGFEWRECAHMTVVYTDLGITDGMRQGIAHARRIGQMIEHRQVPGWEL